MMVMRQQPTLLFVIHQRTQVDDSYKYPYARVPNDSYTIASSAREADNGWRALERGSLDTLVGRVHGRNK